MASCSNHVGQAVKVGFRRPQPQFGIMAARIEARDPGGFFQNAPPRLWLGRNQLRDLALPHQRRAMRPGRGIGEQHLHIARAHFLAVNAVNTARVAGDAAHDVQRVGVIERRRGQPVGIVDLQGDFSVMARTAAVGACEDHIVHARAAHGAGTILAHHPAQRFQQVRLAATIGADHAGQPRMDRQIRLVNKAFEAIEAQARKLHVGPLVMPRQDGSADAAESSAATA